MAANPLISWYSQKETSPPHCQALSGVVKQGYGAACIQSSASPLALSQCAKPLALTTKTLLGPSEQPRRGSYFFFVLCGEALSPTLHDACKNGCWALGKCENPAAHWQGKASKAPLSCLHGAGAAPTAISPAALSGVLGQEEQPVLTGSVSPPCSYLQGSQPEHTCSSASKAAQRAPQQPSGELIELTPLLDVCCSSGSLGIMPEKKVPTMICLFIFVRLPDRYSRRALLTS